MKENDLLEHCKGICEREGGKALGTIARDLAGIEWDIGEYLDTREVDADELSASLAAMHIALAMCMAFFRIDRYDLDKYLNKAVGGDNKVPILQRYAAAYPEEQRQSDEPLRRFLRRCQILFFLLALFARVGDMNRDLLRNVLGELCLCAMETVCRFRLDQAEIDGRIAYLLGADE